MKNKAFLVLSLLLIISGCIIRVQERSGYGAAGSGHRGYSAALLVVNRATYPVSVYVARGATKQYLGRVPPGSKRKYKLRPGVVVLMASGRAHFKHRARLRAGDTYIWEINP